MNGCFGGTTHLGKIMHGVLSRDSFPSTRFSTHNNGLVPLESIDIILKLYIQKIKRFNVYEENLSQNDLLVTFSKDDLQVECCCYLLNVIIYCKIRYKALE